MTAKQLHRAGGQRAVWAAGLLGLASVCTVPALAQAPKKDEIPTAPTPTKEDEDAPAIMNILTMALIALVVLGVSAIPSKRGHQD